MLAIGDSVPKPQESRKTMRLCGAVGNLDILILVDSGSVGSFIN